MADYTDDASVIEPGVYEKGREEIRTNITVVIAKVKRYGMGG